LESRPSCEKTFASSSNFLSAARGYELRLSFREIEQKRKKITTLVSKGGGKYQLAKKDRHAHELPCSGQITGCHFFTLYERACCTCVFMAQLPPPPAANLPLFRFLIIVPLERKKSNPPLTRSTWSRVDRPITLRQSKGHVEKITQNVLH
jgi:hypothetical protein